jgi:hypothetical protein
MDLRGKTFVGAELDRADLTEADLRLVDLSGANRFACFLKVLALSSLSRPERATALRDRDGIPSPP